MTDADAGKAERSQSRRGARCARCGESGDGRFCAGCGALLRDVECVSCGHSLSAGARFCDECGVAVGAGTTSAARTGARSERRAATVVVGAAVLTLVAFVAGQAVARRTSDGSAGPMQAGTPLSAAAPTAPDISNMSPEERASRLFNRVMSYSEQGKMDSARFFAPMAIQAFQMLGPLDAHARYDIGDISAAVGEMPLAKMEADSILAKEPRHLLGLALAIRAAKASGDSALARTLERRLVAAAPTERPRALKEYTDHSRDIDEALRNAGAP